MKKGNKGNAFKVGHMNVKMKKRRREKEERIFCMSGYPYMYIRLCVL